MSTSASAAQDTEARRRLDSTPTVTGSGLKLGRDPQQHKDPKDMDIAHHRSIERVTICWEPAITAANA